MSSDEEPQAGLEITIQLVCEAVIVPLLEALDDHWDEREVGDLVDNELRDCTTATIAIS